MSSGVLNPTISVMLSACNAGLFLGEVLQCVHDFEVVVVDDGSADDAGELLRIWVACDSRLKVIARGQVGPAEANAAGVLARGIFFARMDGEDIYALSRFE